MSTTNRSPKSEVDAKDTSWFRRGCKEVVPNLVPGRNRPQDISTVVSERGLSKQNTFDGKSSAVFINANQFWTGYPQILGYYFIDGPAAGTEEQKKKVREVIDEWTWYANVVFQEAKNIQESVIRIQFDSNDGSWSYFGRQCERIPNNEPTMNLAWLDRTSPNVTSNERAVILHEFGHALGLVHERQSQAHGGYAVGNLQAAIEFYSKTQGWSTQQVYDQVIDVYGMSDVSNFSHVDTRSIMHYPQQKEITGLAQDIPYNTKLTDMDKAYVMLQYPRKEMHPRATLAGWSFEKALDVIGASKEVKAAVLDLIRSDRDEYTGEISPINIRLRIQDWIRKAYSSVNTSP